jgi:CRP-like cAMP-binding protein
LSVEQSHLQNRLLSRLSGDDFALLAAELNPFDCPRAMLISAPGEQIPYLLFPETGAVSIVVTTPEGQIVEAGLVGREGFVNASILLGTDRTPYRVEVQIAGWGHRIDVPNFLEAVTNSETLRLTFMRFAHTLNVQTAYTAASNALHPIEVRLARWLLMCHDRSAGNELYLTHKFMAVMLAVRRASVTIALHILEGKKLIRGERGHVVVVNRAALESFVGDAYGGSEAEYRRLLGPL